GPRQSGAAPFAKRPPRGRTHDRCLASRRSRPKRARLGLREGFAVGLLLLLPFDAGHTGLVRAEPRSCCGRRGLANDLVAVRRRGCSLIFRKRRTREQQRGRGGQGNQSNTQEHASLFEAVTFTEKPAKRQPQTAIAGL